MPESNLEGKQLARPQISGGRLSGRANSAENYDGQKKMIEKLLPTDRLFALNDPGRSIIQKIQVTFSRFQ